MILLMLRVMKRSAVALFVLFASARGAMAAQFLYVAPLGESRLRAFHLDGDSGELRPIQSLELPANPAAMAINQSQSFLYCSIAGARGGTGESGSSSRIATIAIDKNGGLVIEGLADSPSTPATHLTVDATGRMLFTAHLKPGKVCAMATAEDGVYRGKVVAEFETAEWPHYVLVDSGNRILLVPHAVPNQLFQFSFDADRQTILAMKPAFVAGPEAVSPVPRNVKFHPRLPRVYVSHGEGSGLAIWGFDGRSGIGRQLESHSTLEALPDPKIPMGASDVALSPDGRFVYVANRDLSETSAAPRRDSLVCFELNPATGLVVKRVGLFPTDRYPHCIAFERHGRYLYCTCMVSGSIVGYRIDRESGRLTRIATHPAGNRPRWMVIAEQP